MKLHYTKILLFSLPLNILVSLSYTHSKNKRHITAHNTPIIIPRVLSECDIHAPIYYNDEDMKSVKENFDRQTSRRFEEYEERMITQRQKFKEKRDKDIQKIILNDKIDKSLVEKVEQGCLKCGCGLGGVAASIGIIGPIAVNEWTKAATVAAIAAAKEAGAAEGASQGAAAGAAKVVELVKSTFKIEELCFRTLESIINTNTYTDVTLISGAIQVEYQASSCFSLNSAAPKPICSIVHTLGVTPEYVSVQGSSRAVIGESVKKFVAQGIKHAEATTLDVATKQTAIYEARNIAAVDATYASCQNAIIASTVVILVIVLVMLIIYLILRYRRRKKMNKKQQYTKLLNQ
ncbi:surface antigen [Plasmodium falciparum UGT5.1]|uniref:Surface antigen n=1 Tax=Plasmodium falciparum UGT5.1 TaxID=1237627 RepID=W7JF50_PLAFA|nr:surface antigen [Plasmodium falciparum UGT5.1]